MVSIRQESAADFKAVYEVNLRAFGRKDEANLVDALRGTDGFIPELSLVAEEDGKLRGHLLLTRIHIKTKEEEVPVLALVSLAVLPKAQKQGIGGFLMGKGMELAKINGYNIVVASGHPEYYSKFGFTFAGYKGLTSKLNSGSAFMLAELSPDALDCVKGEVIYPQAFFAV